MATLPPTNMASAGEYLEVVFLLTGTGSLSGAMATWEGGGTTD